MRHYEARARVAASPAAVWAVLTHGGAWSQWDSGVDGVEGRLALGEYTGPRLGVMWRSMPDLGPSFTQFADGLKRRVESESFSQ